MKCRLKRINKQIYFNKHITENLNHWVPLCESKIFNTVAEARAMITLYKIKNVEIEKVI